MPGNNKRTAKKKIQREARSNKGILVRFLVVYLSLMTSFFFLVAFNPVRKIIDLNGLYSRLVVFLAVLVLRIFGVFTHSEGSIIYLKGMSMNVLFGCNGLEAFLIYAAAVLSFPAPRRRKLWGLLVGFLILQPLNIIRIVLLGFVGLYLKDYFYYFHFYVAQGIMVAVALVLFLGWLSHVTNKV